VLAPDDSRCRAGFWDADLELSNGKPSPLWIGSVVEERIERPLSLFSFVRAQADANTPRDTLARMLGPVRIANRSDNETDAIWDGGVLLLR